MMITRRKFLRGLTIGLPAAAAAVAVAPLLPEATYADPSRGFVEQAAREVLERYRHAHCGISDLMRGVS